MPLPQLAWDQIDRESLLASADDTKRWLKIYDKIRPILEFTRDAVEFEFDRFVTQAGKEKLNTHSVRIKEPDSFIKKLPAIASRQAPGHISKFRGNEPITIFDLVNDLVGGRFVFHFERDIQDAVIFWLSHPAYFSIEIAHWKQDLVGYDQQLPATRWFSEVESLRKRGDLVPKASGYESLHFIMAFHPDLFRTYLQAAIPRATDRTLNERVIDKEPARLRALCEQLDVLSLRHPGFPSCVRFEVQCRTLLEHAWAEVEHRANYATKKAGYVATDNGERHRLFRTYKASLRAAQVIQNYIRSGFHRADDDDLLLAGRSVSMEIGERSRYWNEHYSKRLSRLHGLIEDVLNGTGAQDALIGNAAGLPSSAAPGWLQVVDDFQECVRSFDDWENRSTLRLVACSSTDPWEPELAIQYGQSRYLALLLGFILTYLPPDGASDAAPGPRARAARLFHSFNLPEAGVDWAVPRLAVLRLYEQVRLLDQWFYHRSSDRFFYDPLPGIRAAHVYSRHFGSLRRTLNLLRDARRQHERYFAAGSAVDPALSKAQINLHLVEAHWAVYQTEGRLPIDLKVAIEATLAALKNTTEDSASEKLDLRKIRQKLFAHLLTMMLFDGLGASGRSTHAHADDWAILARIPAAIGGTWWREGCTLLLADSDLVFERDIRARGDAQNAALDLVVDVPEIERSTLRLQGSSIARACQALARREDADHLIVSARRRIRQARAFVTQRLKSGDGLALPFHLEVAQEVFGFICMLCSDDLPAEHAGGA